MYQILYETINKGAAAVAKSIFSREFLDVVISSRQHNLSLIFVRHSEADALKQQSQSADMSIAKRHQRTTPSSVTPSGVGFLAAHDDTNCFVMPAVKIKCYNCFVEPSQLAMGSGEACPAVMHGIKL
jgi:hypothetical protein